MSSKKRMTDQEYYEAHEDYDIIKDFLNMDNVEDSITPDLFPPFQPDFSTAIVVDNIPQVGPEKFAKLKAMIYKIFARAASSLEEDDVEMPVDPSTNISLGFCFIKFATTEDAENSMKAFQGFALDKKHLFKINLYSDLDKFESVPEEYEPPTPPPFVARPDPTSWLTDEACRDQFVVRHGKETGVYWNNSTGEDPNLVYGGEREKKDGKNWCESYVSWSPSGTYLATFHAPGIRLWGSTEFSAQGRFMHQKVEDISFSPCENYIITYRFQYHSALNPAEAVIVWDIRTGARLRAFELKNPLDVKFQVQATVSVPDKSGKLVEKTIRGRVKAYDGDSSSGYFTIEEGNVIHERVASDKVVPMQEPNRFKWSPDGKYLARLGADIISVYQLPQMTLLEQKSIAAKDICDFSWSPSSNMISYWSPAVNDRPAIINIIELPSRREISSRKVFEVTDGRMVWQNDGKYLCVYMTKVQGKKKSYVLMFFRINANGEVPVEQLELSEPVLNVSWEPSGDKVAVIHGEARQPQIAFYSMAGAAPTASTAAAVAAGVGKSSGGGKNKGNAAVVKAELTHLFTKSGSQCNEVFWSPAGGIIALAYFAPDACIFDLHDVDTNTLLATRRHDRCTRLIWDPSGRYLASCTVTDLRNQSSRGHLDDGINIYSFQGTIVCQIKRDKLYQFLWRPRPKDLLSPEERKAVIKNIRKYEKEFEKKDRAKKQEMNQEVQLARHKMASEFLSWLAGAKARSAALKHCRVELRDGYDSDDERNYKIETTIDETVLSSKDQIMH